MEKGEDAYQDVVLTEGRNRNLSDLVHLGLIVPASSQSACPRTRDNDRGVPTHRRAFIVLGTLAAMVDGVL
jgi:hypothetical protein